MTILFRLAIVFLAGGLFSSVAFVYFTKLKDDLTDDINLVTLNQSNYNSKGIEAVRRALEITTSIYRFYAYVPLVDMHTEWAKTALASNMIKNWTFINSLTSDINKTEFSSFDGQIIVFPEVQRMVDLEGSIDEIAKETLGMTVNQIREFTGNQEELLDEYVKGDDVGGIVGLLSKVSTNSIIKANKSTQAHLIEMYKGLKVLEKHYASINKQNFIELEKLNNKIPWIILLVFVGQFGVFVITGYVDFSMYRAKKKTSDYRKNLFVAGAAVILSGSGFVADQVLLQMQNNVARLQLSQAQHLEDFRTKRIFANELREIHLKLGEVIEGSTLHLEALRLSIVSSIIPNLVMIPLVEVVHHLECCGTFEKTEIFDSKSFQQLKKLHDDIAEIQKENDGGDVEENISNYFFDHINSTHVALQVLQNEINREKAYALSRATNVYGTVQKLGSNILMLLAISAMAQGLALFLVLVLLRRDPETLI